MKRYRLLKDLPGLGAGFEFDLEEEFDPHFAFALGVIGGGSLVLPKSFIINSDWFEEVKEDFYPFTVLHRSLKVSKEEMGFPEKRRKARAYFVFGSGDWEVTSRMYDSYEAARRDYHIEEVVVWPALPDKDGYYPGPK